MVKTLRVEEMRLCLLAYSPLRSTPVGYRYLSHEVVVLEMTQVAVTRHGVSCPSITTIMNCKAVVLVVLPLPLVSFTREKR